MPKQEKNKIDAIKEIINHSGNNFHYKVVNFLREKGWTVSVSPYYNDNLTDKPREIDIIAEKEFDISSHFGGRIGSVNAKLFIECKYINSEIVFWFDSVNKESLTKMIMRSTGLESHEMNTSVNGHRLMDTSTVAKLFSSRPDKSQENEIIYKALNQSLNAMVYYKNSSSILPENLNKAQKVFKMLNYPVIICNDFNQLYRVNAGAGDNPQLIADNFQLEVNYAYLNKDKNNISEYFLIDVVNFGNLDVFLKTIEEKDIKIVSDSIRWKHQHQSYEQNENNQEESYQ